VAHTATQAAAAPSWATLLAAPPPLGSIDAMTFLKRRSTASQPVDLECSDGKSYVVKALRNDAQQGRMMFNDQVIARFGKALNAPVADVALVIIAQELIALNPEMGHIVPCVAHGSALFPGVSERIDNISHVTDDDNKTRFAAVAVLHAWMGYSDRQFIYEINPDFRVLSVDHGHFFPNGPNWTQASLQNAPGPTVAPDVIMACTLAQDDLVAACKPLATMTRQSVAEILGFPPSTWDVPPADRAALAEYLWARRDLLLSTYS
jgi:hypothetical protein